MVAYIGQEARIVVIRHKSSKKKKKEHKKAYFKKLEKKKKEPNIQESSFPFFRNCGSDILNWTEI